MERRRKLGSTFHFKKLIKETIQQHHIAEGDDILLGTATIRIEGEKGATTTTRALCDNGSQVNLITSAIVQQLGEKVSSNKTTFVGIGGNQLGSALGEIRLKIRLNDGSCMVSKFFVVKSITNYNPSSGTNNWAHCKSELADKNFNKPGKINALLGVTSWISIIEPEIRRSQDGQSIAHKTKLGYVILEKPPELNHITQPRIGAVIKGPSIAKLMEMMQKLWEVEEIPQQSKRTKEEQICEDVFTSQHTRTKDGKYIVRIPFNDKIGKLGRSKKMAIKQFFATESRMRKNTEFAEKYRLFMSEYETLGHMESIWENEETGYYTPHHGILSANKFRVVFNASSKTSTGITLNEAQLVGEKLQRDLVEILISFRLYRFGVSADIEKMYRQIWIHKDDRKYQKILWRYKETEPLKVYQLKTVTYGHACAPHSAIRALVQCANDHETEYPRGAKLVRSCFYVDDLLTGAHTETEVLTIKTELTSLLKRGGFNLTKWKTNGKFNQHVEFAEGEEQSVLGLCWNLATDKFFYKLREPDEDQITWTKRRILSKLGKMYDPNGFLGPVIMRGKIIIQELWRDQMDWDQEIEGVIKRDWTNFNQDLKNIHLISINRWIGTVGNDNMQLHGFCDASEKGYGAVIYSRVREGETYRTEIIAAKSRVAPLKVTTIPRLELCSANLLANLLKTIEPLFHQEERKVTIYCWSDSQVTLQWLNKPSKGLKVYVGNRVANVQTISESLNIQWRWIAGKHNPADLISRGTSILTLNEEVKWGKGPDWLYEVKEKWPEQPTFSDIDAWGDTTEMKNELKTIHLVKTSNNQLMRGKWSLLELYGDWKKLVNVTTTILRAVHNFKQPKDRKSGRFSVKEENEAINYLIREDQKRSFPAEVHAAKFSERTVLAKLVLAWDAEFNFLRIDGRVRSNNMTRDQQYPILLDRSGFLAKLLIRDTHYHKVGTWPRIGTWPGGVGHGGTQLVLQYLREKYWIIGARILTKSIIRKCPICFKLRMESSTQLMASLPNFRTTPKRAFSCVGVDYAGPVMIRSSLGRLPKLTKAWIAVFVCLVTRAIHLELVSDNTTQAFIAALRRMVARRGGVTEIISDNAKNFVGANNFLTGVITQLEADQSEIETQGAPPGKIKWRFTTPAAPHQGGIYEAAVKSVKHHLVRIIGETTLTFEEYATLLCQTEAYVNSRPLTPLNDDPTSINALTPGHFLIGEALVKIPEEDVRGVPENRLNRWYHVQKMSQHFWDRWYEEYLNTLINRSKWLKESRNFKVGDLVILKEDDTAPIKWPMARVQEVFPGPDNLVRSVIVRTATGLFKRPITKLGLLLNSNED